MAAVELFPARRDYLILDSGSDINSVSDPSQLTDFTTLKPAKVQAFGGSFVELRGHEKLRCFVPTARGSSAMDFPRVELLPSGATLAYISSLTDHGFMFILYGTHTVIVHPNGDRTRCGRVGDHRLDFTARDKSTVHDVAFTATDDGMREELLHIHCSLTHASATQILYLPSAWTGRTLNIASRRFTVRDQELSIYLLYDSCLRRCCVLLVHLATRYAYLLQLYCDDLCLLVCRA